MILQGDKDKLLIGPFIGEFGHELFSWQAYMREYAKSFNHVVVSTRKEYIYLYEDFADEFLEVDPRSFTADTFNILEHIEENDKMCKKIHSTYNINKKYTVISPNLDDKCATTIKKLQEMKSSYIMYGTKKEKSKYDIIFHPRNFSKFNGRFANIKKSRDWGLDKWNDLGKRILDKGYKVGTIGLSSSAFYVEGSDDLRDTNLKDLADILHNTKCILGPSSGPMHFATLCGCPQLVWSHPCNKQRYLKIWNPFNIKVKFHDADSWNPSVNTIMSLVEKFGIEK